VGPAAVVVAVAPAVGEEVADVDAAEVVAELDVPLVELV
jgi:hypothetical protein